SESRQAAWSGIRHSNHSTRYSFRFERSKGWISLCLYQNKTNYGVGGLHDRTLALRQNKSYNS
ncbi:hypothetical protein, partial [Acinetobacter baumannii]|uniref:hypothetical protein n=1 Tax=Acinetobacter baumannii TaxID=470 RepID=UPI003D114A4F